MKEGEIMPRPAKSARLQLLQKNPNKRNTKELKKRAEVEEKLKTLSKALLDNLSKEQYREVMLNVIANEGMENV